MKACNMSKGRFLNNMSVLNSWVSLNNIAILVPLVIVSGCTSQFPDDLYEQTVSMCQLQSPEKSEKVWVPISPDGSPVIDPHEATRAPAVFSHKNSFDECMKRHWKGETE